MCFFTKLSIISLDVITPLLCLFQGQRLAQFFAVDPDAFADNFTFTLESQNNNAPFEVRSDSLYTTQSLNYESQSVWSLDIVVTDKSNLSFNKVEFKINLYQTLQQHLIFCRCYFSFSSSPFSTGVIFFFFFSVFYRCYFLFLLHFLQVLLSFSSPLFSTGATLTHKIMFNNM